MMKHPKSGVLCVPTCDQVWHDGAPENSVQVQTFSTRECSKHKQSNQITSDVTRCTEALKHVSVMQGVFVSRLASFRGGAKNDDIRSLAAWLDHVTASESGSGVATRFNSDINPSAFIQDVGYWKRAVVSLEFGWRLYSLDIVKR